MLDSQRLKIAVFIDFDNIEIGVKTTLHTQFDIAAILDGIKERGEVVTKVAYGDWKRAGDYGRLLSQHAIRMVQRNLTPGGDKNGADINLALDALEMAFTHDHINAFVIVGGDSDFITLVEKLKQYDKKVFVVGGRQFTSQVMQKNCHEFIAYENLVGTRRPAPAGQPGVRREAAPAATADVAKVIPLVKRALKVLADREVSPQLGLLKSTLLQLDSTFSERDYGVSSFRDFIEKIAKTGIITIRHSGRSMMVDLAEGAAENGGAPALAPPVPVVDRARPRGGRHIHGLGECGARFARPGTTPPDGGRAPRAFCASRPAAALADVRAADQTVFARHRFGVRRTQVGVRHDHGVPAGLPARRGVEARARPPRSGSRVPRAGDSGCSGCGSDTGSSGRGCGGAARHASRTRRRAH